MIGTSSAGTPTPPPSKLRAQALTGLATLRIEAMTPIVPEGGNAQFRVSSDKNHETLDLDLVIGGAASDADFVKPILPIKFPGTSNSMVIDVPIKQDDLVERDEKLSIAIAPQTGYVVDETPAIATITSDDVPEVQIIGGAAVAEGGRAVVAVVADQAPVHDTQIALTPGGDATAGKDYEKLDPYVVLRAGKTRVDIPVQTLDDDTLEDTERVVVAIASSPSGAYKLGRESSAVVTIDRATGAAALPTVTLRANATHIAEGQPVPLSISLSRALSDDLTLELDYAGDASSGADFNPAPGRIVVPAGTTSMSLAVPTVDDDIVERDHALTVSLTPSSAFHTGTPSSATVVIESDDLPELRLSGGVDRITEGGSRGFTIVADQAPVEDISISYQVLGSATPGQDFDALPGVVILPAGATEVTVPVLTAIDDVTFKPTDMIAGQWPIRIGQVLVDEGQSIAPATPLMSLTDPGLTVTLRASATDRTKLKLGQKATVKLQDSSDEVEGTISALDETASVDEQTKEQYYEGKIAVGELPAADGATVTIQVVLDQRNDALTVPIAAVKQNGDGKDVVRVMDLDHGGAVKEMPITTGISEGSYIEVRNGLEGGEVVVVQVDEPK